MAKGALLRRIRGRSPFTGDIQPHRVPLIGRGRPSLPIPHPWNYQDPLAILAAYYHDPAGDPHNRYFDTPGLPLGMVTRDPAVIKAVLLATGDKPGQFDRDTAPTRGIARFTGADTMLYANGPYWRMQKKLAAPSFSRSTLFQPEKFHEFEETFRHTIATRLAILRQMQKDHGEAIEVGMEREISVVMLEMLVNNFFGGDVEYDELRYRYAPAITNLIRHMVRDTVGYQVAAPLRKGPTGKQIKQWKADFEELTDIAMSGRKQGIAAWAQFKSEASDAMLRSNIRVFLAGALEATTSLASWAISHLSHRSDIQDQILDEIKDLDVYDPDNLAQARTLNHVIEETLRLTPALYFLPRLATVDSTVETEDGRTITVPKGTHVVLDVWHANRVEAFWGKDATGYPAADFEPTRWEELAKQGKNARHLLHFGFGHGPRVCPGKFLGVLEVGLVVGAICKVFRFEAVHARTEPAAGVSTKPADGARVMLSRR